MHDVIFLAEWVEVQHQVTDVFIFVRERERERERERASLLIKLSHH